jgi:type-F conjugative transfer system pilin assembly protein TrbC
MEKEKLLCFLKMMRFLIAIILILKGFYVYAEDAELEKIINELHMKKIEQFKLGQEFENEFNTSKPQLLIFVSTSMPLSLLKNYYKEAAIYNGILVFKGLPNGSFKELSNLIGELVGPKPDETNASAGAIIDDESFERFGVTHVPSFVLYKEEECFTETSCKITYDKIVGNIGIRAVLNEFIDTGEMKEAAIEKRDKKI